MAISSAMCPSLCMHRNGSLAIELAYVRLTVGPVAT